MENKLKEYKRIWRIRHEYIALHREYPNRHKKLIEFSTKTQKIPDPKSPNWT
jgi:hypothetical protein